LNGGEVSQSESGIDSFAATTGGIGMSQHQGGNNVGAGIRVYEKDFVLDFHKGFILNEAQYAEVVGYLTSHDFDALESFLNRDFADDASIVSSLLAHQKLLKKQGYYDSK
jgi:hypothetical protein